NIWKRYSMRVSKNWVKFNKMFTLSPCHLELAHVKCSHPPQSLWPDLEMCCARGADTSSQGEKKDTKRATSCEVALSKRLGWGRLNWIVNLLI
ncbi:hypothetical protein ACK31J_07485, partial [Aeromonas caviae]